MSFLTMEEYDIQNGAGCGRVGVGGCSGHGELVKSEQRFKIGLTWSRAQSRQTPLGQKDIFFHLH